MRSLLSDSDVDAWVDAHPDWSGDTSSLRRTVGCPSFLDAVALVNAIAAVAERRNHHPDMTIRWKTLHFVLSTHDRGGVTDWDTALAEEIEALLPERLGPA